MALVVEKTTGIGFCFGVKSCIDILEKFAQERGQVESLGAPVHNQQVLDRLAHRGIRIANEVDEIQGNIAAISAHGVGPMVEAELRARCNEVIDTTCPFVHRAQITARRLAEAGFFVIVYGEANHPEVKGILGWANGHDDWLHRGMFLFHMDFHTYVRFTVRKPRPKLYKVSDVDRAEHCFLFDSHYALAKSHWQQLVTDGHAKLVVMEALKCPLPSLNNGEDNAVFKSLIGTLIK